MPGMFRNAFDAMIRGREAQARRHIAHAMEGLDPDMRRRLRTALKARGE